MAVDARGAVAQADRISELIAEALSGVSLESVGRALLLDAAARAPSVDEEYRELNAEAGESPLTPRAGNRSADEDGRIRFEKDESTYLKNAIPDPVNMEINAAAKRVRVGNREFLDQVSRFSYTNVGAKGTEHKHEVPANGGYFEMFDGGTGGAAVSSDGVTTFTVYPHDSRADGGGYPLRPGADVKRSSMVKSIKGRNMFNPTFLAAAAQAVLENVLAKIGPNAKL